MSMKRSRPPAAHNVLWLLAGLALVALSTPLAAQRSESVATPPASPDDIVLTLPGPDGPVGALIPAQAVLAAPSRAGDGGSLSTSPAALTNPDISFATPDGTLTTLFASNNGFAGNTFDVTPQVPLTIYQADLNLVQADGGLDVVAVYWRVGTAVGNENSRAGWNLLGVASGSLSQGQDVPSPVPLRGLTLLPGQTYGIYIDMGSYPSAIVRYTNGGPTTFSNADLTLTTNDGRGNPAFVGAQLYPRQWNGTLHYNYAGPYVLDAYGGLNPAGAGYAPSMPTPYFGFDIARDVEFSLTTGFYVLDGFGGVHAGGGGASLSPATPYFGFDIARDLEITEQCYIQPLGSCRYYVLDGFGGVHAGGGAPVISPATPYFGFDAARDLELRTASSYYVLDGFGGLHAGGFADALVPATPYFGFDVAVDLEFPGLGQGFHVLDRFGGLHNGGGAAPLSSPTPYFGFDAAIDLEFVPGGYYVLDRFGGLHAGGGAPAISPAPAYFGFDAAEALEFR